MQTEHITICNTPVQVTMEDSSVFAILQIEEDKVVCFVGDGAVTKEALLEYCLDYLMYNTAIGRSTEHQGRFLFRTKRQNYSSWTFNRANELNGDIDENNCFQLISVGYNKGKFEYTTPPECKSEFQDGFQYSGIDRLMIINQLLDNGNSIKMAIHDSIGTVMGYLSLGNLMAHGFEVAIRFTDHKSHSQLALEHMYHTVVPSTLLDENLLASLVNLQIGCLEWDVTTYTKPFNELHFKLERPACLHYNPTTPIMVFELSKSQ